MKWCLYQIQIVRGVSMEAKCCA